MAYYSAISVFSLLALGILAVLVRENSRLDAVHKRRFYRTYVTIGLALTAEWLGLLLNGTPEWTRIPHLLVKCLDYSVTPVAGVCFIYQVSRKGVVRRIMWFVLALNAVFEFISLFTGWCYYLDAENFYHHGPLYPVYVGVYCCAIVAVVYEFVHFGQRYRNKNRFSLYSIVAVLCLAILSQELWDLRVCYLAMIFGTILLFIHYSEFTQLQNDDVLVSQKKMLETDVLTGLLSRYAYTQALAEYADQKLPEDLAVFSIDVDGLKRVNDSLGHLAGDELLQGAASCIRKVLGKHGKCYRTGGDEFIALLQVRRGLARELAAALQTEAENWHGSLVPELHFSVGLAFSKDEPELSVEKLIGLADNEMYQNKKNYYSLQNV